MDGVVRRGVRRPASVTAGRGVARQEIGTGATAIRPTPQAVFSAYPLVHVRRRKCLRRQNLRRRLPDAVRERSRTKHRKNAGTVVVSRLHNMTCDRIANAFPGCPSANVAGQTHAQKGFSWTFSRQRPPSQRLRKVTSSQDGRSSQNDGSGDGIGESGKFILGNALSLGQHRANEGNEGGSALGIISKLSHLGGEVRVKQFVSKFACPGDSCPPRHRFNQIAWP